MIVPGLRASFEDHVERRLGRAPDAAEPAGGDDLAQALFAGLRTQCGTDLLRQQGRHAAHDATDLRLRGNNS